jgi:hypothetical protein
MLEMLDRPRTLEEILQNSKIGNFEACRLMWGMLLLGIAEQILATPSWATEAATQEFTRTAKIAVTVLEEPPPPPLPVESPASTVEMKVEEPTIVVAEPTIVIPVVQEEARAAQDVEQIPPADLSFSDLADLTDSAEQVQPRPVETESNESAWEKQVPFDIKLLNEQHRYVFEMLRLELGAGVNPFLSKMVKKVSAKYPLVFDGVRLNDFGEFEEASLTSNIEGNLVEKYQQAFDYLLNEELESIRSFLDQKRVASIENGLARISQKQGLVS